MQNSNKIIKICDGLIKLLKAERDLLGEGQYDQLSRITDMKATYSEALSRALPQPVSGDMAGRALPALRQKIQRIRQLADENARIFAATIKGADHALARLASLRNQEASVGAYGALGQQLMIRGAGYARSKRV